MSTVDKIDEAILTLKTENIQYGRGGPDTAENKAAWYLRQARELLVEGSKENDQDEPEDSAVPTEAGQEGEVSPEATEETESEATGVAVETVFTGESAEAPADGTVVTGTFQPDPIPAADPSD